MGLLLHAYDPVGVASLFANAAAQGAQRQQQQMQMLMELAKDAQHSRQLSIENERRLDFEKSKEAEKTRQFDVEHKPFVPPSLPGVGPSSDSMPTRGATDAGEPGLDANDAISVGMEDAPKPGVNLYNTGGPQPLTAPLIPRDETSAFLKVPGGDTAPDVPDVPVELAPSQMRLQPPDLAAVSAQQTGGLGSAFGPVDPFAPPEFAPPEPPAPPQDGPTDLIGTNLPPGPSLKSFQAANPTSRREAKASDRFAPPELPKREIEKVKNDTIEFAQSLAGLPQNEATRAITHFATNRALQAGREDANTLPDGSRVFGAKQFRQDPETGAWSAVGVGQAAVEDLTKEMTFDAATNTYANKDGAKFFVGTSTTGKPKLTPWKPEAVKAKRTFLGSDGKPYSIGTDGSPLQPIPEGVQLMEGKMAPARTMPDGSLGIVNPDRTVTTLIPATIKLGDKAKSEYLKSLNDAHTALMELNATELQYQAKPGVAKDWYGITDKTVKEKRDAFDAAQRKVVDFQTMYPALRQAAPAQPAPASTPAAPAATKPIDAATAKKFLEQAGGDKEKARALAREAGYGF